VLGNAERTAIAEFVIMWSVFEAVALGTRGDVHSIITFVDGKEAELENPALFSPILHHFTNRYVEDSQLNHKFEALRLRNHDRRTDVEGVLLGEKEQSKEIVKALLIIVYRLRNNLFHGNKWGDEMRDQQRNFDFSCQLMMRVLDAVR